MPAPQVSVEFRNVSCPFCGLVCDDLVVAEGAGRLKVRANGCRTAASAFERESSPGTSEPRISGHPAALKDAIAEAARLLRGARQPLIAGLATDVAGAQAAGSLADRCGGVLDHMNSPAMMRNTLVLQDTGWITTTLSEVRNRADLLVIADTDVVTRFPRFFERCIANQETLFGENRRCEIIFLGPELPDELTVPGVTVKVVPCDTRRLHEAFGLLRALAAKRQVQAAVVAGVPLREWQELADLLCAARYGVVTWAAADFDFPHAELAVQALCELVKDLNRITRFSCLPLGGSEGDLTADSVHLWQTGFGSRTAYGSGHPEYDPYHLSVAPLLQSGEADALVWISSFNEARTPPSCSAPTIVLGRAGMVCAREPEVFIPVGTPGMDHAGHLFRTDRVVALPLRQLRESSLPSVAEVIRAIEAALGLQ
jgi:formylmethanofuran dehydrogenase subunit B